MRTDIAASEVRILCHFMVFQCYTRCKLYVYYCTGIWTGAAMPQLCLSQGDDTQFTSFRVFVADACDICDVVVSGPLGPA